MRSVADQLAAVLGAVGPVVPLDVVLADAAGCVLAADLTARQDVPPVALAGCDGYAVRAEDVVPSGQRLGAEARLPVVLDARPTSPAPVRLVPGTAVLVAAGAPLPLGADAVVPAERTDRGRAHVVVRGGATAGEHVRPAGRDAAVGAVVLRGGTRLAARHLAIAAALGQGRLWVHPAPRVVVVSVGDELVEPGRRLTDGTVHDSLGVSLVAAAHDAGTTAIRVGPVPDDRSALREVLADQMVRADLLLLTGGLSGGPWDTVADVLAPMGTVRFDQVALTPGRRLGFGTLRTDGDADAASDDDGPGDGPARPRIPVFALPGHPVAALTSFEMFVRPALRSMAGYTSLHRSSVTAASTVELRSPAGLRQVVPATLRGTPASGYRVAPVGDPDQVSLSALAASNALMILTERVSTVRVGDTVTCMVLEG
jgi:molybdopterin molybdotransferase